MILRGKRHFRSYASYAGIDMNSVQSARVVERLEMEYPSYETSGNNCRRNDALGKDASATHYADTLLHEELVRCGEDPEAQRQSALQQRYFAGVDMDSVGVSQSKARADKAAKMK